MRYQLCIKAYDAEVMIDDIVTPEFTTPFAMPLSAFLLPELSAMNASTMLRSLNLDAKVLEYSILRIAKFLFDVAKVPNATLRWFRVLLRWLNFLLRKLILFVRMSLIGFQGHWSLKKILVLNRVRFHIQEIVKFYSKFLI